MSNEEAEKISGIRVSTQKSARYSPPLGYSTHDAKVKRNYLLSLAAVLVTILCGCTVLLAPFKWSIGGSISIGDHPPNLPLKSPPECAPAIPLSPTSTVKENVWDSITVGEAATIRKWLFEPRLGLNLTQGDAAKLK